MRMATISLLLLATVVTPRVAWSSELSNVPTGARVRIALSSEHQRLTGRYVGCDQDSLTLLVDGASRAVRRDQIQQLAVSGGRPSRLRRAVVGAGIGAAGGVPAAAFTGEWHVVGPLALWGAVVSISLPAHERWNTVCIGHAQLKYSPDFQRGPGIALTIAS